MTKKSILIGVLAALMLFAFTACEDASKSVSQSVSYITIRQVEDIVAGQPFDANDFEIVLHDASGKELGTIDGAGKVAVATGTDWFTAHKVSANLKTSGGIYSVTGVELTADYTATVETVTSASITGFSVVAKNDDFAIEYADGYNRNNFQVVFSYDGGTTAFTGADIAEVKITPVDENGAEVTEPVDGTTYDVILARYRFAGTENDKAEQEVVRNIPTNLTVTYKDAEDPVVTSVVMGYFTGNDSDGYEAATAPEWYNEETTNFKVLANYSDGTQKALTKATATPTTENAATTYTIVSGSVPTTLPVKAVDLKIVYNGDPTLNIPVFSFVGKDWVKAITAEKSSSCPATIKATDTVQKSWFDVTATTEASTTKENFTDFGILNTDLTGVEGTYNVTLYCKNEKGNMLWTTCQITVSE